MRKITVKCTFFIEVEVPADEDPDLTEFVIEDNSCPGTGRVWGTLAPYIEECNSKSICWACNLQGRNEIVDDPGR